MKLSYFSFLAVLSFFLLGCTKSQDLPKTTATLVDSFEVHGIDMGQMVQHFNYENDTTLYSYCDLTREIVYYFSKKKNAKAYTVQRRDQIDTDPMSRVFEDQKNRKYFISRDNKIAVYNPTTNQKLSTKAITHSFQSLKRNFGILPSNIAPAGMFGDTMVTSFTHNNLQFYKDQFSENSMAEFSLRNDSVELVRSYFPKPAVVAKQFMPFPIYCFDENRVHLMYPGLDTIYSYDRNKGIETKTAINNPEYVLPEPWDFSKLNSPEYSSYQTKYDISTFSYMGFLHDQERKLYYLFYITPVDKNLDHVPTPNDQKMKILVLDENFNKLRVVSIPKHNLVITESYFFIPGKGLVVPEFKGYDDFETTTFYIYNL